MFTKPAPFGMTVTGRVEQFLQNPQDILGVSCTVVVPLNALFGTRSITESLIFTSRALRNAAGVAVHLSNIDQKPLVSSNINWRPYIGGDHLDSHLLIDEMESWRIEPTVGKDFVIKVADSMQGVLGSIEDSWLQFVEAAIEGKESIVIDLSDLRAAGTENGKGLTASGPVSFVRIYEAIARFLETGSIVELGAVYSSLNETLRRGGKYKNGAITIHCDYTHPECLNLLDSSREKMPYARLSLNINEGFIARNEDGSFKHPVEEFLISVIKGDSFVQKIRIEGGIRLYGNVCEEIYLRPQGTCLLAHLNVGKLKVDQIPSQMEESMDWVTELHNHTEIERMGLYLSREEDRQVGLGVLGLASHLAANEITYLEFCDALEYSLRVRGHEIFEPKYNVVSNHKALALSEAFIDGFNRAAKIAKERNFDRAFTVAPTTSCSYKSQDLLGYTSTPEIAPPKARLVDRTSEAHRIIEADYNPDCEVAEEVGWETHWRLNCLWQTLMNSTGLAHSISMNWWVDQVGMDRTFIERFIACPLWSLYYAYPVKQNQDKSEILGISEYQPCAVCAE